MVDFSVKRPDVEGGSVEMNPIIVGVIISPGRTSDFGLVFGMSEADVKNIRSGYARIVVPSWLCPGGKAVDSLACIFSTNDIADSVIAKESWECPRQTIFSCMLLREEDIDLILEQGFGAATCDKMSLSSGWDNLSHVLILVCEGAESFHKKLREISGV